MESQVNKPIEHNGFFFYISHEAGSGTRSILGGVIKHRPLDAGPLIKVRMLSTIKGSPDGICVEEYSEGGVYEIPGRLAGVFLKEGWAEALNVLEVKCE